MACFLVPGTEAIVTSVVSKVVESKEKNEAAHVDASEIKYSEKISLSRKLKWLNNMLWGGTALLAFEHVWHGEVVPFFPFLSAASNPADAMEMLGEMSTVGVGMAALVTIAWVGVCQAANIITNRQTETDKQ